MTKVLGPWVALTLCGCNDISGVTGWLGLSDPEPLLHASLPQEVAYDGPVLVSPQVVPIFFESDPYQADVEQFLSRLPGSEYWKATTSEYGVGDIAIEPSIVVSGAPPPSTLPRDIGPLLATHLDGTHPEWPAVDPQRVYVVLYPESALSIDTDAKLSSDSFDTYHSEWRTDLTAVTVGPDGSIVSAGGDTEGPSFTYAAVAEWPLDTGFGGLDWITEALWHELIEASTDPLPNTNKAYEWIDGDHLAWSYFFYSPTFDGFSAVGEVTDLCQNEGSPWYRTKLDGFSVERSWSNAAASANQDPCVPAPETPYFNAAPDLVETVLLRLSPGYDYDTAGIRVPLHETRTVDVRLFSTGPRPDWYVAASELFLSSPKTDFPSLEFKWNKQTGNDGHILRLSITRLADGPIGGTQIRIRSTDRAESPTEGNSWMGFVAN